MAKAYVKLPEDFLQKLSKLGNRTDEICSEFGSISFEPKFGGVVRKG